jgi:hypothetical protein
LLPNVPLIVFAVPKMNELYSFFVVGFIFVVVFAGVFWAVAQFVSPFSPAFFLWMAGILLPLGIGAIMWFWKS